MRKYIQLVSFMFILLMSACTESKDKKGVDVISEKPRVKLATVTARQVDQILEYTATVEAEDPMNAAKKMAAQQK